MELSRRCGSRAEIAPHACTWTVARQPGSKKLPAIRPKNGVLIDPAIELHHSLGESLGESDRRVAACRFECAGDFLLRLVTRIQHGGGCDHRVGSSWSWPERA